MVKTQKRSKATIVLLGTLGIILITLGAITTILTLGTILFALLGIADIDLGLKGGSSVDPMTVWSALLFGGFIGLMILLGGVSIFVQRKSKPAASKLPPFPY